MKPSLKRVDILTLFPGMFTGVFSESLLSRAQKNGLVEIAVHNIRDYSDDVKHKTVDDRPYGGGAGMVMKAEPIYRALKTLKTLKKAGAKKDFAVIYLSPQGAPLTHELSRKLTEKKRLVLLCGHYEGIDERLFDYIDLEVSVGEAVYTGGEIPAMALTDAVVRHLPGVVKEADSLTFDSFAGGWGGLLDCPHYTRPEVWRGRRVPQVLLEGHHEKIRAWRQAQSLESTRKKRPDILKNK